MKKFLGIISSAVVVLGLFTIVTYANDWLMFSGKDELYQSTSDVNEIISLLEGVQQGKESAEKDLEDALIKLENLQGLDTQVDKLKSTISLRDYKIVGLEEEINEKNRLYDELKAERDQLLAAIDSNTDSARIAHLEEQLRIANQEVKNHKSSTSDALEQARKIVNGAE